MQSICLKMESLSNLTKAFSILITNFTFVVVKILVSFAEVRSPPDTAGGVQNSAKSNKEDGFFKMVKGLTRQKKKKNSRQKDQLNSCNSDESLVFDSDDLHGNESTTTSESSSGDLSLGPELESSQSLETTQNYMVRLFTWKKRRLSLRSFRNKTEPLIKKTSQSNECDADQHPQSCSVVESQVGFVLSDLLGFDFAICISIPSLSSFDLKGS